MVNDSKILTVSYGTFSCTLEGFDDPFSTMRSIAEYFRDLAADDRYFGAEPPTPDPQMLHSIAEKEIQRRVEARVQDNGLVLRQMGETQDAPVSEPVAEPAPVMTPAAKAPEAAPTPTAPAPQAQQPAAKAEEARPAPATDDVKAAQAQPATRAAASVTAAAAGSTIADKLERIRAAVAQRNQTDFSEDQNVAMSFKESPAQVEAEDTFDDVSFDEADVEDEALTAQPKDAPRAFEAEVVEPVAETVVEPVAKEIAEPVAKAEAEAEEISSTAAPFQEAAAIISEMNAEIANENSQVEVADTVEEEVAEEIVEEASEDDAKLDNILSSLTAEDEEVEDTAAEPHEMDPNLAADIAESAAAVEDDIEDETADLADDPLSRVRARMEDMPQAEEVKEIVAEAEVIEAEVLDADEAEDDDITSTLRRELGASSLDEEAEEDLMRELAEVAAIAAEPETAEEDALDDDAPEVLFMETDESDDSEYDDDADNVFDTSDASVSRLLDETDREMAKGENTRRRNAIEHLKAAVGAIRAEKSGAKDATDEDDAQEYKEDLARVVRPTRPEGGHKTRRKLPPLMLVSEQRIDPPADLPSGADITPVRPRRVSRAALAVQEAENFDEADAIAEVAPEKGTTFTEFAETLGAESLPELLEAATAFSNFVQGRETVTRPQIMHLAQEAMPEDMPVEERLRSFGQLLRQGKIRKLSRGRFAVAESTRFKLR
ncbi:hypothetical protein [Celeribacter halophilus]|uniref:hypothetical protein n=1 Tax=Celeribacter halophilus TaxID=576117 RepID=UPI001C081554|nr:hypothetical protein [Celeribacter halophilus]MBU2889198.1 hypothetical protein [Celeribacter halophilus]